MENVLWMSLSALCYCLSLQTLSGYLCLGNYWVIRLELIQPWDNIAFFLNCLLFISEIYVHSKKKNKKKIQIRTKNKRKLIESPCPLKEVTVVPLSSYPYWKLLNSNIVKFQ